LTVADIPVDLLTASASGLDPDISVAAAEFQAARIAEVHGLTLDQVSQLIDDHTSARTLGILGAPRVNVLELNLALQELGG
jgi:K+-transporting ATPase ATPase C chain